MLDKVPNELVTSVGVELITWIGDSGAIGNEFLRIVNAFVGKVQSGLTERK